MNGLLWVLLVVGAIKLFRNIFSGEYAEQPVVRTTPANVQRLVEQQQQVRMREEQEQLRKRERARKALSAITAAQAKQAPPVDVQCMIPQTKPDFQDQQSRAEIERLQALQMEYRSYLDAIGQEEEALRQELQTASEKRASVISSKLTVLAGRRASTTRSVLMIDSRIDRLYDSLSA